MDRNFSRSLAAVLVHEGGYVNNKNDPGGPTNLGITLANFRHFVKPDGTIEDLKKLTREQAGVVFRRQYWDEVMASELPDGVDHATFDFAVNSGPGRAAKYLQAIAGVQQDGKIGPATLKAVKAMDPAKVINALCTKRQAFLEGLGTFSAFGKGWTARVKQVRTLALELAAQPAEAVRVHVQEVEVPVDVPVPVVPKGSDKPGIGRWMGGLSLAGMGGFFTDIPVGLKYAVFGLVVACIIVLLWRGEQIATRAKRVLASFER